MSNIQPRIQQRIYEILESSNPNRFLSNLDDWGVTLLVILDVTVFILETAKYTVLSLIFF
jgi:voltage-gated potassium channel